MEMRDSIDRRLGETIVVASLARPEADAVFLSDQFSRDAGVAQSICDSTLRPGRKGSAYYK